VRFSICRQLYNGIATAQPPVPSLRSPVIRVPHRSAAPAPSKSWQSCSVLRRRDLVCLVAVISISHKSLEAVACTRACRRNGVAVYRPTSILGSASHWMSAIYTGNDRHGSQKPNYRRGTARHVMYRCTTLSDGVSSRYICVALSLSLIQSFRHRRQTLPSGRINFCSG